jgi:hypothetical protein
MDARRLGSKACTALLKTLLLIFNLMFLVSLYYNTFLNFKLTLW